MTDTGKHGCLIDSMSSSCGMLMCFILMHSCHDMLPSMLLLQDVVSYGRALDMTVTART